MCPRYQFTLKPQDPSMSETVPLGKKPDPVLLQGITVKKKCGRPRNPIPRHKRESHINAEYRRRGNIQSGLRTLKEMLRDHKTTRLRQCNAGVLLKVVEHLKMQQKNITKNRSAIECLKAERDVLRQETKECQVDNQVTSESPSKPSRLDDLYVKYIQDGSASNWRFRAFTFIMTPLFETYKSSVQGESTYFYQSLSTWANCYFTRSNLKSGIIDLLQQYRQESFSDNIDFYSESSPFIPQKENQYPQQRIDLCSVQDWDGKSLQNSGTNQLEQTVNRNEAILSHPYTKPSATFTSNNIKGCKNGMFYRESHLTNNSTIKNNGRDYDSISISDGRAFSNGVSVSDFGMSSSSSCSYSNQTCGGNYSSHNETFSGFSDNNNMSSVSYGQDFGSAPPHSNAQRTLTSGNFGYHNNWHPYYANPDLTSSSSNAQCHNIQSSHCVPDKDSYWSEKIKDFNLTPLLSHTTNTSYPSNLDSQQKVASTCYYDSHPSSFPAMEVKPFPHSKQPFDGGQIACKKDATFHCMISRQANSVVNKGGFTQSLSQYQNYENKNNWHEMDPYASAADIASLSSLVDSVDSFDYQFQLSELLNLDETHAFEFNYKDKTPGIKTECAGLSPSTSNSSNQSTATASNCSYLSAVPTSNFLFNSTDFISNPTQATSNCQFPSVSPPTSYPNNYSMTEAATTFQHYPTTKLVSSVTSVSEENKHTFRYGMNELSIAYCR